MRILSAIITGAAVAQGTVAPVGEAGLPPKSLGLFSAAFLRKVLSPCEQLGEVLGGALGALARPNSKKPRLPPQTCCNIVFDFAGCGGRGKISTSSSAFHL